MKDKVKSFFGYFGFWHEFKKICKTIFEMIICPAIVLAAIVLNLTKNELQIIQIAIDEEFWILFILLYISIGLLGFALARTILFVGMIIGISVSVVWYKLFKKN